MQIVIRATNISLSDAIRNHVFTRVGAALRRFAGRVSSVQVVIEDVNGPKGGEDIACRIEAGLERSREPLVISEQSDDLYGAVDLASSRLKQAMSRRVARRKDRKRRAVPHRRT